FFIISSIAVQTSGIGFSNLLAVGTTFTGSGNLYCQWELSPGSGNALCILFPTQNKDSTNCKDYAQNVKNQSKPGNIEHKIGSLQQKPNQRAFFSSNQAMKPKSQKIQNSGSILAKYQKSNQEKKENRNARAQIAKSVKL
nr:hypothetical protein [Tanacetum cinerariifolium]